ncbi:hypothetical protein [Methanoculleus sp.]|uniref:hypothetical protein n=1 Tax=Methanoculleus sp. TaxID=90427 RepID=UPI002629F0C2|nr:hypothetical protein [Methanoculleus sp.]MDI6867909.1 hypothetical protein [Methanoculleus sp.]
MCALQPTIADWGEGVGEFNAMERKVIGRNGEVSTWERRVSPGLPAQPRAPS